MESTLRYQEHNDAKRCEHSELLKVWCVVLKGILWENVSKKFYERKVKNINIVMPVSVVQ